MDAGYISIIILVVAMVFYITELLPIPVVALSSAAAMAIFKVLPGNEAWASLATDTVLIMAGITLVGSTLFHTGAATLMAEKLINYTGGKPKITILIMLGVSGAMSSLLSNTTSTILFLPLILSVVAKANDESIYEQKYMQMLTLMTSVGGLITLVGSPVNIAGSGMLKASGFDPFTFTQFTKIAIPMYIVSLAYVFTVGDKIAEKIFGKNPKHSDFVEDFIKKELNAEGKEKELSPKEGNLLKKKQITSVIILIITIVGFLTQKSHGLSLGTTAIIGGLACVITKCVTVKEMYQKIDWGTIFLLAGTIGAATGLAKSGGGQIIADFFVHIVGGSINPMTVFISLSLASAVLTQFMSNTGTVSMLIPIGVSIAAGLGMDPLPIAMGITLTASCSFLTPMASPTQAMIMNWGSYKFNDYLKYSGPISLVLNIMILVLVPMFFPLT
ncbi:MAG: SLC13 family permease [Eubacteriales bacterium]